MNLSTVPEQRLAPLRDKPAGQFLIHEIYYSVQGESTFQGLPCVFVRLTTCHARCVWCDTPHAFKEGKLVSFDEVLEQTLRFDCPLVEITGGEPLLQAETRPLMQQLADRGRTVLIETSGLISIEGIDPRVHIIMDLKCPDSGECEQNVWSNLEHLKPGRDEIKFVIASRRDFDWTVETIRTHSLEGRFEVLLSAVFGKVEPVQLVNWLLATPLQVRMQLQMHKYVWPPQTRGV